MSPLWALREICYPGTATGGGSGPSATLPSPVTLSLLRHPQDGQRFLPRREPRRLVSSPPRPASPPKYTAHHRMARPGGAHRTEGAGIAHRDHTSMAYHALRRSVWYAIDVRSRCAVHTPSVRCRYCRLCNPAMCSALWGILKTVSFLYPPAHSGRRRAATYKKRAPKGARAYRHARLKARAPKGTRA